MKNRLSTKILLAAAAVALSFSAAPGVASAQFGDPEPPLGPLPSCNVVVTDEANQTVEVTFNRTGNTFDGVRLLKNGETVYTGSAGSVTDVAGLGYSTYKTVFTIAPNPNPNGPVEPYSETITCGSVLIPVQCDATWDAEANAVHLDWSDGPSRVYVSRYDASTKSYQFLGDSSGYVTVEGASEFFDNSDDSGKNPYRITYGLPVGNYYTFVTTTCGLAIVP